MYVIHPHLPRAVTMALAAALAAIVITLALAARVGDVQLGQRQLSGSAGHTARRVASGLSSASTAPGTPRSRAFLSDPFAPLVIDPIRFALIPGGTVELTGRGSHAGGR